MKDFIFVLLDTSSDFDDHQAAQKARGWSIGFTRFKYDSEIIESKDPDELLKSAAATGARFCVVLPYGSFISEIWKQNDSDAGGEYTSDGDILNGLALWSDDSSLAVTGKFSSSGSGDAQLLFVNFEHLSGNELPGFDELCLEGSKNPLPLHLSSQVVSLQSGDDGKELMQQINGLTDKLRKSVFVWNIENYDDIESPAPTFTGPLSSLYTVAAGFKPNRILETHGFDSNSRLVIFDYSKNGLRHRQLMHETWDGVDYPAFLRRRFKQASVEDVHYLLWQDATPENLDWTLMEARWQQELDVWGGATAFRDHWQKFQALDCTYLHCDLLNSPEQLLALMRDESGSLIWWSNAFLTLDSIQRYSTSQRKAMYSDWIDRLKTAAPKLHLYGSDCNNLSVNGHSATHYSEWLKQPGTDPLDALVPVGMSRIKMRY